MMVLEFCVIRLPLAIHDVLLLSIKFRKLYINFTQRMVFDVIFSNFILLVYLISYGLELVVHALMAVSILR